MRTSRLKNIVIVILLLVNVFLLVLLLSRRAEERGANERRIEQLCELFERSGVTFDRALLPEVSSPLSLSLSFERDPAREADFASALLGSAERSDSGGVSRFTGELGSCSIRSGGTVDALLSRPVEDPEIFAHQLFKSFGYAQLPSQLSDGSGSITGVRSTDGLLIFNAALTLTFSDGALTGVPARFCRSLPKAAALTASTRSMRSCAFLIIAAPPALCVQKSARSTRDTCSSRPPLLRCGCKAYGVSPRTSIAIM